MTSAHRQPPRKRHSSSAASASSPREVAALLARRQAEQPSEPAQPKPSAGSEPVLPFDRETPGFTSGTLTEAVPVSHGGRTYRVKQSDTIMSIARAHGVSVPALIDLNELRGKTVLRPGQILSLPEKNQTPPPASHRVRAGETLEQIAARYGTTVGAIRKANAMKNDLIAVGEILMLTGSGAMSSRQTLPEPQALPTILTSDQTAEFPAEVLYAARVNKYLLNRRIMPRKEWVHKTIMRLAGELGVDSYLALAVATHESGLSHRTVSPVNAIGIMQLTPRAGQWAGSLVGRSLDILDPVDNITAGIVILRHLLETTGSVPGALAAYYQGAASVQAHGMAPDTRSFVRSVQVFAQRYHSPGDA